VAQGRLLSKLLQRSRQLSQDYSFATILGFIEQHWETLTPDQIASSWFSQCMTSIADSTTSVALPSSSEAPPPTSRLSTLSIPHQSPLRASFEEKEEKYTDALEEESISLGTGGSRFMGSDMPTYEDMRASLKQLYDAIPSSGFRRLRRSPAVEVERLQILERRIYEMQRQLDHLSIAVSQQQGISHDTSRAIFLSR